MDMALKSRTVYFLMAVLEESKLADFILDASSEAELEEMQEALELAGHLIDVKLGLVPACPDYLEEGAGDDKTE